MRVEANDGLLDSSGREMGDHQYHQPMERIYQHNRWVSDGGQESIKRKVLAKIASEDFFIHFSSVLFDLAWIS